MYGHNELNEAKDIYGTVSNMSLIFNNLDGNKTNFDALMAQIDATNYPRFLNNRAG